MLVISDLMSGLKNWAENTVAGDLASPIFLHLHGSCQELTRSPRKSSSLTVVCCLLLHALKGKNGNNYAENIRPNCRKCSHLINCAPM